MNKQHFFKLKLKNQDIGGYGITFNKKSQFIFKTKGDCEAFFIRKKNWHYIIGNDDSREIIPFLKEKLRERFEDVLDQYLNNLKKKDLEIIQTRTGPDGII